MGGAWYDTNWEHRLLLTIDNVGGTAGAIDLTFDLSLLAAFDHFWDNIQADGDDIRMVDPDGYTLLTYDVESFNATTRTGTIEVDNYDAPAEGICAIYLYYGYSSAADATTTVTPSGALTIKHEPACPGFPLITAAPLEPGSTNPPTEISKTSLETLHVWWDVTAILEVGCYEFNGTQGVENVDYLQFSLEQGGTTASTAFWDETANRFVETPEGRTYLKTIVKSSTDANNYTLAALMGTTLGRVLDFRAIQRTNDPTEQ
jgi:hypothetical protein